MGTTSNRSYPYPAGSDPVDVPGDLQALADDVDTDMAAVIAYDTAYVSKSSAYTLVGTDRVIDVTGTTTITLPAAASHTGRVYVVRNTGSNTVTVSGVTGLTLPGKGTATVVSDGSAWSLIDGTYTDESVGRRIFTWDAVNARWQMTYGDTGWRNVSALVETGTTGSFYVRRLNNTVHMRTYNANNSSGAMLLLSAGFRLDAGGNGTSIPVATAVGTVGAATYNTLSAGSMSLTSGVKGYAGAWLEWSYITLNAWPTSLPGTASGSIPS